MDPISTAIAFVPGTGTTATAQNLLNVIHGIVYGPNGPQTFSFTDNGILGKFFAIGGQGLSLKPDFISQVTFGRSFSIYDGLRQQGFIGNSIMSPQLSVGGQMSPQLGTAIGATLK